MHLVRFRHEDTARLGALKDSKVVDLTAASGGRLTADINAWLSEGVDGLAAAQNVLEGAGDAHTLMAMDIEWLPPATPGQIICLGLNYHAHAIEAKMDVPASPVIFTKSPGSVIAHGEAIVIPREAPDEVDYEVELAFVIGRPARHVARKDALTYIAGYTCANDVSSRDLQFRTSQWVLGKTLDTFCPLGPALVTADEVPDPQELTMHLSLNGQEMQAGKTDDMIFDISYTVEYLSGLMTLQTGDVILTGTPPGVGFSRKPPVFLKPGDVVEITIEGLGTLRNPVVAE
jgi:2-keto-4-pentenoate hydratase/2-oxohepta-3-ene-1,7-dioic acid hydratase in catechol pathway